MDWRVGSCTQTWKQEAAHQLRLANRLPPRVAGRPQEVDVADARHLHPPPAPFPADAPNWEINKSSQCFSTTSSAPVPAAPVPPCAA